MAFSSHSAANSSPLTVDSADAVERPDGAGATHQPESTFGVCFGCGYDCRGLPDDANVCPECGSNIDRSNAILAMVHLPDWWRAQRLGWRLLEIGPALLLSMLVVLFLAPLVLNLSGLRLSSSVVMFLAGPGLLSMLITELGGFRLPSGLSESSDPAAARRQRIATGLAIATPPAIIAIYVASGLTPPIVALVGGVLLAALMVTDLAALTSHGRGFVRQSIGELRPTTQPTRRRVSRPTLSIAAIIALAVCSLLLSLGSGLWMLCMTIAWLAGRYAVARSVVSATKRPPIARTAAHA